MTNLSDSKPLRDCNGEVIRLIDPTARNKYTRSGDQYQAPKMVNTVLTEHPTSYEPWGHDVDTDGPYP